MFKHPKNIIHAKSLFVEWNFILYIYFINTYEKLSCFWYVVAFQKCSLLKCIHKVNGIFMNKHSQTEEKTFMVSEVTLWKGQNSKVWTKKIKYTYFFFLSKEFWMRKKFKTQFFHKQEAQYISFKNFFCCCQRPIHKSSCY